MSVPYSTAQSGDRSKEVAACGGWVKKEEGGAGGGIVANGRDRQARRRDGTTELEGREGVLAALSPKVGSNPRLIMDGAEVALAEGNRKRGVGTVAKKGKRRRVWGRGRGRGRVD